MAKRQMPKTTNDPWKSYTAWLREKAPEAFANLAPAATSEAIAAVEKVIGQPLPKGVRRLLSHNDGQRKPDGCSVLPGLRFLSCKHLITEWKAWASTRKSEAKYLDEHDAACSSLDPGVRAAYTVAGWIPLFQDEDRADYFGIDLEPSEEGKKGQVINFGRDENDHFVAFEDVDTFLAFWLEEARAGRCKLLKEDAASLPVFVHRSGNSIDVLRQPAVKRAKKRAASRKKEKPSAQEKMPTIPKPTRGAKPQVLVPDPTRDLGPRYEQLDRVNQALLVRLEADKKPLAKEALYWQAGERLDGRGGPAWTRSETAPRYREAHKNLAPLPGPGFSEAENPATICKALILSNRKSKTGPRAISFQYQRDDDGAWRGDYAVETQAQYRDFCKKRRPFEDELLAGLKVLVDKDVKSAEIELGTPGRKSEGPQLVVSRFGKDVPALLPLPDDLLASWNELIAFLQGQRISRLLHAYLTIKRPTPKATIKEHVLFIYCR